jgi:dephospho-CoA kinase
VIVLGLTGSIGMGKTATAKLFAERGIPVWDADAAVARLYARAGAAVPPLAEAFPAAVREDAVDRAALRGLIAEDPAALARVEAIVHPLVAADRAAFLAETEAAVVLLDIPLLFETGLAVDCSIVVTAPPEEQRRRVLSRGTMTEAAFEDILSRQMPDAEKRARADYVIDTLTPEHAAAQVDAILEELRP